MKRINSTPRDGWQKKVESVGLTYHTVDGRPYWDESACYCLSAQEVDDLEAATNALQELCIQAGQRIIDENLFDRLAIPLAFRDLVCDSWERDAPSLYGRFDLRYDGMSPPKLLEYNADTPTALVEAAVAQWYWLEDTHKTADQFNSIHEKLIASWKAMRPPGTLYLACVNDCEEDLRTVEYLMDTAMQAGITARHMYVEDIGWGKPSFLDLDDQPIRDIFKLYPWEWLIHEDFGKYLLLEPMRMIEPAWKMMWSNKGILPILWEMFPNHPNLLPAFSAPEPLGENYVRKPLLSREGANIAIRKGLRSLATDGEYGEEGFIYQQLCELPRFDGNFAVVGSWVIGGEAAGVGMREDTSPVTGNLSRFVPHYFV
ncbi:MAG: glutathionylspermidine synthase family protein [Planctomycetota bacterium]|nr:glutathionylspermidine synthase family protein [Planctomycetota bacterium]